MNLKSFKAKRLSDSTTDYGKALKVIEKLVEPIDPVEGDTITVTEEELGVPVTEELRQKVEDYLTDKYRPEEGTEEYDAWEWHGEGTQTGVEIVDGALEIEIWFNA